MKPNGFTLIEVLVAMIIFVLIVSSASGLLISGIHSQIKVLNSRKLLDETSYIMEYMSRALRMAKKELPPSPEQPNDCLSVDGLNYENPLGDTSKITFINMYGECQEFFLESGSLKEWKSAPDGTVLIDNLPLTSNDFEISSLKFFIQGEEGPPHPSADNLQPRVTISLIIKLKNATKPEIKIQTTISQRNLDI